ncbi:MAG: NYN domain-containing protein [Tabrizicola sp.]
MVLTDFSSSTHSPLPLRWLPCKLVSKVIFEELMDAKRIALLVDGENLSADHAGFLITTAASLGTITVKRVYGAVTRMGGWASAPGYRVVHVPPGKNAGDIALSLEALELALTRQVDEFVIATSDRDISLVAMRLVELGFPVTGVGESKAPPDFRKSCRKFVLLPIKTAEAPVLPDFTTRMRQFLKEEGAESEGWVSLSAIGQQRAKEKGISKAEAGLGKSASWLGWFKKDPKTFEIEERGTQSRARLRPVKKA